MKEYIFTLVIIAVLFTFTLCSTRADEKAVWQVTEFVEIDKDSIFILLPEGQCWGTEIPELQRSVFYCKPTKTYEVCEGDTWENIAGLTIDVITISENKFRWRVSGKRMTYEKRFYCGEDNKPDLCEKLIKRGKGKCVTIDCGVLR